MIQPNTSAMILQQGISLILVPLVLAFTIFWIWMLVDSAKRKQFIWLAAIALTHIIGAFAYFLFGRNTRPTV